MTVSSDTNKKTYSGNGSTHVFSTDFTFAENGEVSVTLVASDGTETGWLEGTQYILTGAGTGSAGTVTVGTSPTDYTPATGTTLVIELIPDFTQETELPRGGTVSPKGVLEPMHDKRVRQMLRLKDMVDRAIKAPITEATINALPPAADRAGKALIFDVSGDVTVSTDDFEDQATAAAASAAAAAASASSASTSADTATTQAGAAAASAVTASNGAAVITTNLTAINDVSSNIVAIQNAATNASTATTQAGIAATSASNAATSDSSASTSATNAANSASDAAASAAALPNAAAIGNGKVPQSNGTTWVGVTAGTGDMIGANNLVVGAGGIANAATARTNLGLGTAATVSTGVANGNVPLMDATGYPAANGSQITNLRAKFQAYTTVASAGTVSLDGAGSSTVQITGTTTITAITLASGSVAFVEFAGALTLTNGASLILPGGANITTAAGDTCVFIGEGAGVVRAYGYQKANGQPVVAPSSGAMIFVASTSVGTGATFDVTGLASGYDYVFMLDGVYPNVADQLAIRYQQSASFQTTSYAWTSAQNSLSSQASPSSPGVDTSAQSSTTAIRLLQSNTSSTLADGGVCGNITLYDPASTSKYCMAVWELNGASSSSACYGSFGSGQRSVAAAVTGVRFLWVGGNNFSGGTVNTYKIAKA